MTFFLKHLNYDEEILLPSHWIMDLAQMAMELGKIEEKDQQNQGSQFGWSSHSSRLH